MIAFRVYPGKNNRMAKESLLYWEVRIYESRSSMYRFVKEDGFEGDYRAIVMPRMKTIIQNNGPDLVSPSLGMVLFARGFIDAEVVCHECVHMATGYMRRCRRSLKLNRDCDDCEEVLAYTIGHCGEQISNKLHELKIWK